MKTSEGYTEKEMHTVLFACCASIFITPLMSTMMNLALVSIGHEFQVGSHSLAMVNTTFLLASVIAMVPFARLSDIYGRKRILVLGLVTILIASVLAAFSPSFEVLLIMRFFMGVGAAAMSVSSMAMLTEVFPIEKRGWAIGIQSTFVYLGVAVGPALGGFLSDTIGWRSLFFFMIPFAFVSLFVISRFKKEIKTHSGSHMDIKGSLMYGATIVLTMYGAINLPELWAIACVVIGLVLLIFFLMLMKRTESPVLDLKVFGYSVFSRSCIAAFMNYASSYSVSFFMALYLQSIGALSSSQAGLVMLIQPIVQVALTAKFGSYSDKLSDKRILPTLGMILTCAAVLMIIFLDITMDLRYVAVILILLGLGYALFSAPNTNTILSSVPPSNRGEASGMIAVVRQTGMMISMAVAMCCITLIMGSTDNLDPSTYDLFLEVIRVAFTICLAMCIIGTFFSWYRGKNCNAPQ